MDNSEELKNLTLDMNNLTLNNKFQAGKNLSESDVSLKRLSIIPEDETIETDLRVVGFNVKVGGDKAYSFAVEKVRSRSADTFTALDNSNRIFGLNAPANSFDECRGVRDFFKVPNVDEQYLPQDNLTNIKSSKREKSPVLQLNLANENKEFELHVKTKNDDRNFTQENESTRSRKVCFNAVDLLSGTGAPSCLKTLKETSEVPLKYIIELSSRKVQTEKETESSSAQTTNVEVNYPRSTQETKVQTDGNCDASTSTECKEVKSVKLGTEEMPQKEASLQTDIETVTGSSQTETAAIFSIDRVYAASTQTDELANAATSTDFNIYIVDRENITEKATDTEDLPYAPLMVAREEREEADDKLRHIKCCHCSCNHQNQRESAYECCRQKECETMSETNIVTSDNQPSLSCGTSTFNNCSCDSERSNNEKNTCEVDMRRKAHQQCCCQDINLIPSNNSKVVQEVVETLEPPNLSRVSEMECSSLALREKISNTSKVEIVKSLASELQKTKLIVAIREQIVSKVERAETLKVPVIFQHFLNSFSLSVYSEPRAVINPISISLADNHPCDLEPRADKKLISLLELSSDGGLKTKNQAHLLMCDNVEESSVIVSCLPPMMVIDDKHSQVCLCNSCYLKVRGVLDEKRKRILHLGSKTAPLEGGKLSGTVKEPRASTSPKIKCKKFDYMSTKAWRPYEDTHDDVLSGKTEATNIYHVGDSDSDESTESTDNIDLNSACETVNDHLLNLRPVDKDTVRKAAEVLHKAWFETAASKDSDTEEVRYYLRYFGEFSDNLLRTLLHSVDNNGNNILHFAFANNRFDLVEELLKNRFSAELLKKTNKSGNSPLMICSISLPKTESDWSVIRKSVQQGDVNSKSLKSGQTPLMNAASCGFHEMVDLLLDVGADPNLQDKDGSTALMYAAEHGHESCIKAIVRNHKCDPTIKDKDGLTACSIALSNGNKNIAVLIHMHALEKRQLSKHSQSPRRYAWTNNESRNRARMVKPRSPSIHSSEVC